MKENNKQEEEIIQLRQENGCLRDELMLTGKCGQLAFHALAFNSSEIFLGNKSSPVKEAAS